MLGPGRGESFSKFSYAIEKMAKERKKGGSCVKCLTFINIKL